MFLETTTLLRAFGNNPSAKSCTGSGMLVSSYSDTSLITVMKKHTLLLGGTNGRLSRVYCKHYLQVGWQHDCYCGLKDRPLKGQCTWGRCAHANFIHLCGSGGLRVRSWEEAHEKRNKRSECHLLHQREKLTAISKWSFLISTFSSET